MKDHEIIVNRNKHENEVPFIQKVIFTFFGYNSKDQLVWNWQHSEGIGDEINETYEHANKGFADIFLK